MFNQPDKDEFESAKNELHHDWGRNVIVHNSVVSSNTDYLGQMSSSVVSSDNYEILALVTPPRTNGKGEIKASSRVIVPQGISAEIQLICRITKENLDGRTFNKDSIIEIDGSFYNILWFHEERVEYFSGIKAKDDENLQILD